MKERTRGQSSEYVRYWMSGIVLECKGHRQKEAFERKKRIIRHR